VTINQFAEQVYNSKQKFESSDEDSIQNKTNVTKEGTSPFLKKSESQNPAGEMTVQQLKALKRERKKEKEKLRREEEKNRYQEKVKSGLITPLTKEEAAAKIKFFTLATEQRAIQREAE